MAFTLPLRSLGLALMGLVTAWVGTSSAADPAFVGQLSFLANRDVAPPCCFRSRGAAGQTIL